MAKPKILVVEDDRMLRDAFSIVLKAQRYAVDTAANGQEALERCQTTHYALIMLDLMMPVLDGIGFLEQANLATTAPSTRIVLLSNLSSGEAIDQAMALGAHRREVKANLSPTEIIALVKDELAHA
jgi:CheY-like chemotaxis protein